MDDLKIRQKCEQMIACGYVALRQFPKVERHVLGAEIRALTACLSGRLFIGPSNAPYRENRLL